MLQCEDWRMDMVAVMAQSEIVTTVALLIQLKRSAFRVASGIVRVIS